VNYSSESCDVPERSRLYANISSSYAKQMSTFSPISTVSISLWKVAEALRNPNVMRGTEGSPMAREGSLADVTVCTLTR